MITIGDGRELLALAFRPQVAASTVAHTFLRLINPKPQEANNG